MNTCFGNVFFWRAMPGPVTFHRVNLTGKRSRTDKRSIIRRIPFSMIGADAIAAHAPHVLRSLLLRFDIRRMAQAYPPYVLPLFFILILIN